MSFNIPTFRSGLNVGFCLVEPDKSGYSSDRARPPNTAAQTCHGALRGVGVDVLQPTRHFSEAETHLHLLVGNVGHYRPTPTMHKTHAFWMPYALPSPVQLNVDAWALHGHCMHTPPPAHPPPRQILLQWTAIPRPHPLAPHPPPFWRDGRHLRPWRLAPRQPPCAVSRLWSIHRHYHITFQNHHSAPPRPHVRPHPVS